MGCVYSFCGKTTYPETAVNESRLNEDGEDLLDSHRGSALPEVLFDGDTMFPIQNC
jgi:hypothetical protein